MTNYEKIRKSTEKLTQNENIWLLEAVVYTHEKHCEYIRVECSICGYANEKDNEPKLHVIDLTGVTQHNCLDKLIDKLRNEEIDLHENEIDLDNKENEIDSIKSSISDLQSIIQNKKRVLLDLK